MASGSQKKKADLKVVIVGEASVGKTCLIRRYIDGVFHADVTTTLGASFFLKSWGGYNAAIWDTAGEERFSGLSSFYCRGASAAILAFDLASQESFATLRTRFIPLLQAAEKDCLLVVVGTKLDLISEDRPRQVMREEALTFASEINAHLSTKDKKVLPYFETSSKTGQNVPRVFEYIFEFCLGSESQIKLKRDKDCVNLSQGTSNIPQGERKSNCC